MIYGYECRECGQEYTSSVRDDVLRLPWDEGDLVKGAQIRCTRCDHAPVKRKYSISATPIMHEHQNSSTGSLISSPNQFKRELKEMGQREEERTGIPCAYEPIDPDEAKAHVLASDAVGLEETNRVRVNAGQPAIRL